MAKHNELSNIEFTNKSDYIEQAILGGSSLSDALRFWDKTLKGTKATGFRAKFYEALKTSDFTKAEVLTFAKENGGSENDVKGYTHYVAIAELVKSVRDSK